MTTSKAGEFTSLDVTDQAPVEVCLRCARRAVEHGPTRTAIVHCAHTLCGAYRPTGREWSVVRGVEAGVFRDLVVRALTQAELRIDVARDLSHILSSIRGSARRSADCAVAMKRSCSFYGNP